MLFVPQSRARVLLIEAGGVNLLRWQRGSLRLFAHFKSVPEDFQKFENILHMEARVPFIVVMDCIEEDFRIESVAHVTGADRTAMLDRKLGFAYRNTPYKIARVVGREKAGRKDDRVLLTALTKTELIEPWVSRILKEKLPIQAITSAAYMMELLAATTGLKTKPHLLLTNVESGSGMRQTYLQKGRVIFSRLTPINDRQDDNLATMLLEQSVQTRKYLERIKQLPYDTRLCIHAMVPAELSLELPAALDETLLDFSMEFTDTMIPARALALEKLHVGAIAASLVQAFRGKGLINVYATPTMRRFFLIKRIARVLYTSSIAAVLAGILVVSPTIVDTLSLLERESQTATQTLPLMQQYEGLRSSFPETPISSSTMELVVSTFDDMRAQTYNPVEMLQWIGNALLQVPGLKLDAFDWELEADEPTEEEIAMGVLEPEIDAEKFQARLIQGRTTLVTTISGEVRGASSFREARDAVLHLVALLEEHPELEVLPLVMPIDVRTGSAVTTSVDDGTVNEKFTLELRLESVREALP